MKSLVKFIQSNAHLWQGVIGPNPGTGADRVDLLISDARRMGAMYETVRAEFPKIDRDVASLRILAEECDIVPGTWVGAAENPTSIWIGGLEEAAAASMLAKKGEYDTLLLACALLCQGYEFFSADGQSLLDGYCKLLPSIGGYFSADLGPSAVETFRNHQILQQSLDARVSVLTAALNPRLTAEDRESLVGSGTAKCPPALFIPVADALGIETEFLTAKDRAKAEQLKEAALDALAEGMDYQDEVEYYFETIHTAYVVAANADALIDGLPSLTSDAGRMELAERHKWLESWRLGSWQYEDQWPAELSDLAEAIGESEFAQDEIDEWLDD